MIKAMTSELTDEDLELFGALVLNLRATRGLSVEEFARRSGLSSEKVDKIEDGRSEYDLEELYAISRGLEMPVSAIVRIWEERNLIDPGPVVH